MNHVILADMQGQLLEIGGRGLGQAEIVGLRRSGQEELADELEGAPEEAVERALEANAS